MKIFEIITALFAKILPFFLAYNQGKKSQKLKQTKEELEVEEYINDIHALSDNELNRLLDNKDK